MKPSKTISQLRAANPGSQPRHHAYSGSGQWLYWHTPGGEVLPIGVAITLNGTTYRHMAEQQDIQGTVAELWGDTTAWQLGKLLEAAGAALYDKDNMPEGISTEPIPFCHGDNPAQILDRLWRHGVADSLLFKKKPPSQLAERSIDGSNPEVVPGEPASNTPDAAAPVAAPAKRGASDQ